VGHRVVEVMGQCFGVVVRSRGIGGNVMAGLRSIVGGEIHEYTHLLGLHISTVPSTMTLRRVGPGCACDP
jgi:uncharacterized protein YbjQ (UPF0145 family)